MKLSQILGRILTDVALRQQHPNLGVCDLVDKLTSGEWWAPRTYREFEDARKACSQTGSYIYPVMPASGNPAQAARSQAFCEADIKDAMWRGQYGINRRKLVRDCWRWAKERGL